MAVDAFHVDLATELEKPVFRVYRWNPATLSLGYFQDDRDRLLHKPSVNVPLVRRPSGGGGILHHHELTYSFAIPGTHPWGKKRIDFYETVHSTLILAIKKIGIRADLYRNLPQTNSVTEKKHEKQPFLCFQRRTASDIVSDRHKIVGSAQYRRSSGILQHGSILLQSSCFAPELPGISDIFGVNITSEGFLDIWLPFLVESLGMMLIPFQHDDLHRKRITIIENERFSNDLWTKKNRRG